MTTYYVATHACFVLVDAANTDDALELGLASLRNLLAAQPGYVERPIEICACRPATADEIERGRWS
jgi:uncharacterized protein (UPF0212 family)